MDRLLLYGALTRRAHARSRRFAAGSSGAAPHVTRHGPWAATWGPLASWQRMDGVSTSPSSVTATATIREKAKPASAATAPSCLPSTPSRVSQFVVAPLPLAFPLSSQPGTTAPSRMQEAAVEPGRRPAQQQHQFAGVDLRRPKGYAPAPVQETAAVKVAEASQGDPCPRCASRDTKFCYYNNYNTSQPRHFCKGCRRYWTKGGTLRNVPVGGGTRKKPSSSSSTMSSYAAAGAADADNKPPKKKPASKKRRVEAPAPEPAAAGAAASAAAADPVAAADSAKTTTTTTTDGGSGSEITTETAAAVAAVGPPAAAAEDSDSLAHLLLQPGAEEAVSLGLGLSDFPSAAGKAVLDDDSFVWPAAFDLGTCWASAGFADTDPASLFLNLP